MEDSNQNGKPFWKRRKFLINEHLQVHFIGFSTVLSLCASVTFYLASEYFFVRYYGFAIDVGMRPSDPFFRVLSNMEMLLTYIFAVTSVIVVLVGVAGGLLFSHRVAGPMYRLKKHCEAVARGESLGDVTFRKGDYFMEVAEAYNAQMAVLRERLKAQGGGTTVEEKPVEQESPIRVETTSTDLKKAG